MEKKNNEATAIAHKGLLPYGGVLSGDSSKRISPSETFSQAIVKSLIGTSLENAAIEVLTYFEDSAYIVAVDLIGKPCDENAKSKVLAALNEFGLSDLQCIADDVLSRKEGLRIYSSNDKSLEELVNMYMQKHEMGANRCV